jgi:hypothetical protein
VEYSLSARWLDAAHRPEGETMRRSLAASVLVAIISLVPIANAFAGGRAIIRGVVGGPATPSRVASQGSKYTFDTSTSRFTPGVNNQGWYASRSRGYNRNSNYALGECCGDGEIRDFFTFDLGALDDRALSATLVLKDPMSKGNPLETIRFSDVMTQAPLLNHNSGVNDAVFADLGHGQLFGQFSVPTDRHPQTRRFQLNERAVQAINESRGGFFSVGGRLLNLRGRGLRVLFGFSDNRGAQKLIVRTDA